MLYLYDSWLRPTSSLQVPKQAGGGELLHVLAIEVSVIRPEG